MVLAINTIGACMCMHLCWARGHDVCTSNEFLFQLQEIGCIHLALPVVCASVSVCVCTVHFHVCTCTKRVKDSVVFDAI